MHVYTDGIYLLLMKHIGNYDGNLPVRVEIFHSREFYLE